jgi:hypothetical protein
MAYHRMKSKVKSQLPKIVVDRTPRIKATKAQKLGALSALTEIRKLFGPKGRHWVQGDYHTTKEGFDAFCLSGAFNKVDGNYEALARLAVGLAIENLHRNNYHLESLAANYGDDSLIVGFNDDVADSWDDVLKVIKEARRILKAK